MAPLFAALSLPNWIKGLYYIDAGAVAALVLFAAAVYLIHNYVPKAGAVAWVTAKEALFQPLFVILTLVGIFALFIFLLIPYNTLGEDIKLVITQGLTVVKLIAAFLAVWSASSTIADEIEGKTALMALAKPISRRSFVIGKYLGVMIAVTLIFLVLGTFFLNTVSYKVVYDARESSKDIPTAIECAQAVYDILPDLALAYLETIILAAIAIAISTRLPLLPNLTITLLIYLLGNLIPVIAQSSANQLPLVEFIARLTSAVIPCLDHFNMETAVAMGRTLPWIYVGWAVLYAALYCVAALVVSLLLFEDRDMA
ncbi:MAG: ABC transporter permease subunit [Planctomycetaceae bacterium]|jgi:ABC-type transport system involved in multi-copper enzyme maturation permease subunit|nr:ABC transporter permease subunit [Planctomycetaceae bacterium]